MTTGVVEFDVAGPGLGDRLASASTLVNSDHSSSGTVVEPRNHGPLELVPLFQKGQHHGNNSAYSRADLKTLP
jgi:hypothetical protein